MDSCDDRSVDFRQQANARERCRTHRFLHITLSRLNFNLCHLYCIWFSQISVNSAFLTLRELIPTEPKYRKLSKIETLRLAIGYIEHLFAILVTGEANRPCCVHPNGNQCNRFKPICTFCVTSEQRSSDLNESH